MALAISASPVRAQNVLWVSATGSDAAVCSQAAPCLTFRDQLGGRRPDQLNLPWSPPVRTGGLFFKKGYFSALVLVKLPSLPLALNWLLPKEISCPAWAFTPVPLPPMVDAPTLTTAPGEAVRMPLPKLAVMLDSSTVK